VDDLAKVDPVMAQRLFDKTKWLASNTKNLRHEPVAADLPGLSKYAVGDWRIFYAVDDEAHVVTVHAVIDRRALKS
jgi:mRNA interferase RelE/StbE